MLNLFQDLASELGLILVDYLLGARFYAGKMLKQVTYDKKHNWRKGSILVRALTRTPKLGILALGAVEGIDVLSDVANGENIFEATAKSATNLLGSITLSGYCGAIGSKMFGVTGSMLGTGIGNFANNKLNNMFFN